MTVLIRDEFTGMTDGQDIGGRTPSPTNTPGNTWTEIAANKIEGDGAGQIKGADTASGCGIDSGITDQLVSVDFNAGGADNRMSVFGRWNGIYFGSSLDDRYSVNPRTGNNTIHIFKMVDDVITQLGADISFSFNLSTTYKIGIRIRTVGADVVIDALVDDVPVASRTDSTSPLTTGSFTGFEHNLRSSAAARFDNFQVEDLAVSVPVVAGQQMAFAKRTNIVGH